MESVLRGRGIRLQAPGLPQGGFAAAARLPLHLFAGRGSRRLLVLKMGLLCELPPRRGESARRDEVDTAGLVAQILRQEELSRMVRFYSQFGGNGCEVRVSGEQRRAHYREDSGLARVLQPSVAPMADVLSGKFTWKVHNLSLFKEMIKTQKTMSPVFPAGDCSLRLSLYQSSVNGAEYLSMCLESKDAEKSLLPDRSCWCLFRMSVPNQRPGMNHMHRDSYGRFAADNKTGDNTSLGWNGYMKMADFVAPETGYLVEDTAVFSASFHVIKESSSFTKNLGLTVGRSNARKLDGHLGKFTWRIENFTRLKDLLKKRKITGLCVKSRRFQVGNRDCRLIVYPRGSLQVCYHFSVSGWTNFHLCECQQICFLLGLQDNHSHLATFQYPHNTSADWSCLVSHRLSVVNQRSEERSVTKESKNRYSKAAKDWGWREFVTLTSLFD